MHFRPHPRGYMRLVVPVLPWKLKNSTLYKKVMDKQYNVCVVYIYKLLGAYKKDIYYGDEAIEKAIKILKPFKDEFRRSRTVTRFRKREKYKHKDVEEIFDWDYYLTSDDVYFVYIALKKK